MARLQRRNLDNPTSFGPWVAGNSSSSSWVTLLEGLGAHELKGVPKPVDLFSVRRTEPAV